MSIKIIIQVSYLKYRIINLILTVFWFSYNVSNILGNGHEVCFWKEKWLGSETLKEDYLSLFVTSLAKDVVMAYMGSLNEEGWAGCGISSGKGKCHLSRD
jgi:hypothetical protein